MYALYLKNQPYPTVRLRDGCWTNESNCYMREYGVVWHKPWLFATAGLARNFRAAVGEIPRRVAIRKYAGPTEAWDRPNRGDPR